MTFLVILTQYLRHISEALFFMMLITLVTKKSLHDYMTLSFNILSLNQDFFVDLFMFDTRTALHLKVKTALIVYLLHVLLILPVVIPIKVLYYCMLLY